MVKAERISNNNIYYFMKEHPDLRLQLSRGKVLDVIFPENCISFTKLILNGKIAYLQYETPDTINLHDNTYDSSKDFSYGESLEKLIKELSTK